MASCARRTTGLDSFDLILTARRDPLGCGEGERVLVTQGSVAKGWFRDGNAVVDALVVAIGEFLQNLERYERRSSLGGGSR